MSTWCMPWHLIKQGTNDKLPLPDRAAIDLNAGEIAKTVSWIKLLLQTDLDKISPVIAIRIDYELNRRIFNSYLTQNFDWVKGTNNWNVWCNGNVLKAALYTLKDSTTFTKVLNQTFYSVDIYVNAIGDDGATEEGPAYWRESNGRFPDYINSIMYLYPQPETRKYFARQKLLQAMGNYSFYMRISDDWFVDFGDSPPQFDYAPETISNYGNLTNNQEMYAYASYMLTKVVNSKKLNFSDYLINHRAYAGDIDGIINLAAVYPKLESTKPFAPAPETVYMPSVEIAVFRSFDGKEEKDKSHFFLAAQGGNNGKYF